MDALNERLTAIQELNRSAQASAAEREFRALISELSLELLISSRPMIDVTLASFLHKRRRDLCSCLEVRLADLASSKALPTTLDKVSRSLERPAALSGSESMTLAALDNELAEGLAELSERHIFQWATFYRDFLGPFFARLVAMVAGARSPEPFAAAVRRRLAAHAEDIFQKGHDYITRDYASPSAAKSYAITKSLSGLQRFLELPIEFYSAHATVSPHSGTAAALRLACSAMLAGILEGYLRARFGDQDGCKLLPRYPRSWAHYLGFMRYSDLTAVLSLLEPGAFREGAIEVVVPVTNAIDNLVDELPDEYSALPSLGQFDWNERRLDLSLHRGTRAMNARQLEIQCYLDIGYVSAPRLEEAANRGVSLVVAPLRPDVQEQIESHDVLRSVVVNSRAALSSHVTTATDRARDILQYAISRSTEATFARAPLAYNFARDFPLHNPFLTRYFHVYRESVRKLLSNFERRNGVRLWCSVRRSGKTTACFDLGTTSGHSVVISQTCDGTHQRDEADLFYRLATEALLQGEQIQPDFFVNAVERCSPGRRSTDCRYVFVLDEYETLFERMHLRVRKDKEVRYTVVQPLLNQMVAFSRENLLVFMGQRPDAHFIIMEQNQLSPYVQQDSFPLFTNECHQSEFHELLRKVLTERVGFDEHFAEEVYSETAGHPFLTVKMLVHLFDWLIEQRRSVHDLMLTGADFLEFVSRKLSTSSIGTTNEYAFFRNAISEAVDEDAKRETPWLHAVYSVMQQLCEQSPESLRCSRSDFIQLVNDLHIPEHTGRTAEDLLSTGSQSNFFAFDDNWVWPKIRMLGRISRAARRSVRW